MYTNGLVAERALKIQVIVGSTRTTRFSEKPAQWIYDLAKQLEGIEVELVDLRDYPMPFFEEPMSPAWMGGKYPNPNVQRWANKVAEADGYIIVAPEYNHGYPAVLKNAFDHTYPEWNNKPVGFVSYGATGGARTVEQLRQVVIELQMAPIQAAVHVPMTALRIHYGIQPGDPNNLFDDLKEPAASFLKQLTWWTHALKNAREVTRQPQLS